MPLTPADIHNVAFSKPPVGRDGYNEDEVDAFLDLVESELTRLIETVHDFETNIETSRQTAGTNNEDEVVRLQGVIDRLQARLERANTEKVTAIAPLEAELDRLRGVVDESEWNTREAAPELPDVAQVANGVFISYRRDDERSFAGRLYDRLSSHFPHDQIFMDVDSLELGFDFEEAIDRWLARCSVMLVVIGEKWLNCAGSDGQRRLENPDDFVRLEVEAALAREGVRVIPVLVDGASAPSSLNLPDSMASLGRRNGINMSHEGFGADFGRLLKTLETAVTRL
jgi:DivIVA domain-containing protein